MSRDSTDIGRGRELSPELGRRVGRLARERGDPVTGDRLRRRSRLSGAARRLTFRQMEDDEGDAALDQQKVNGDLPDPPVVGGAVDELSVARPGDKLQKSLSPGGRRLGHKADGLAHPRRAVRGFIGHYEGHVGLILPAVPAFVCEYAPRTRTY